MDLTFFAIIPTLAGCSFDLGTWTQSSVSIVYFCGVAVGAFFFGLLGDKLGRKTAFITSLTILTYISFLVMFSFHPVWLFTFRFLSGVGIGGLYLRTAWMFEYLPLRYRFAAALAMVVAWHIGTILEVPLLNIDGFRWPYVVVSIHLPLIPVIVTLFAIPESPRFLLDSGNKTHALESLRRIARMNKIQLPPGELVTEEEKAILCGNATHLPDKGFLMDLFRSGIIRTTFILSITWFLLFFASFGFIISSVELLAISHLPNVTFTHIASSYLCTPLDGFDYTSLMIISLGSLPGLLLFFSLMEWLGRRHALVLNCFASAVLAGLLVLPNGMNRIALVTFLSLLRAVLTAAVQILWVYTPEVYPTSLRGTANGYHLAVGLLGALVTPVAAQELIRFSPHSAEVMYAVACALAGVACFFLPTETKNRQLE